MTHRKLAYNCSIKKHVLCAKRVSYNHSSMKKLAISAAATIIVAVLLGLIFLKTQSSEEAKCKKNGGTWEVFGFYPKKQCIFHFSDGGRSCQNGSECKSGICYSEEITLAEGTWAAGKCSGTSGVNGSHSIIEQGKIESSFTD